MAYYIKIKEQKDTIASEDKKPALVTWSCAVVPGFSGTVGFVKLASQNVEVGNER